MEIDLTEKLKQLEAEVEAEVKKKNEETQKTWEEFTQKPYSIQQPLSTTYTTTPFVKTPNALPDTVSDTTSDVDTDITQEHVPDLNEKIITSDDFSSGDKWVMALAGGGGKGSYQIGVWKALREIGLEKHLLAVSGASVGSLNAALISMGDYETAENIWKNIMPEQFLDINDSFITSPLNDMIDNSKSTGICSREGLINILNNNINISLLATPKIDAYACIALYPSEATDCFSERGQAEYIRLCEVTPEDAKKILLASSAMPYIYPPENIHGKIYRDGGLADNVPIQPLTTLSAEKLIVVKLDKNNKVNTALYENFEEVIEIAPSREIGDLLDGTLDFHKRNVLFRMLLGYYDTLRTFSLRMYHINGIPLSQTEILRREAADYEKVMSELNRTRTINSVNSHMDKINKLISKFDKL